MYLFADVELQRSEVQFVAVLQVQSEEDVGPHAVLMFHMVIKTLKNSEK